MKISNIVTRIESELGLLTIDWNLEITTQVCSDNHPDNPVQDTEEIRDVSRINNVELNLNSQAPLQLTTAIVYDKQAREALIQMILDEVQFTPIADLQGVSEEDFHGFPDLNQSFEDFKQKLSVVRVFESVESLLHKI